MRIKYYKETDILYIDLNKKNRRKWIKIAPGIVVALDENDEVTGIDINSASKVLDLSRFEVADFPTKELVIS